MLTLTNKNNQVLDLLNNRDKFILSAAEGLHGIDTDIAESESAYTDGSNIESVRALPRGIELVFTLRGDVQQSIDFFTSIVKSKQYVTLRETKGDRDISIKGIATIPPYSRMASMCKITLSIYCGQPYWEDVAQIVETINQYINLLYFPVVGQYFPIGGRPFGAFNRDLTKTFTNKSDTTVGVIISVVAVGEVKKPKISCDTGTQAGWYMQVNVNLSANDELTICTVKGEKYVRINGLDEYNGTPVVNLLEWQGEDWLQMETGANTFSCSTDGTNENVSFSITYKGRYE
jgi:hypothetical protein